MVRRPESASPGSAATRWAEAFEEEALAYIDSLYCTALRLTKDAADAEDLVQDTYLKAFRAARQFEPGTNLRAWLFTILHNMIRNRARHRSREPILVGDVVETRGGAARRGTPESLLLNGRSCRLAEERSARCRKPFARRWLRDVEEFCMPNRRLARFRSGR